MRSKWYDEWSLPLVTGSMVYGTPHKLSDLDVVVLVTKEEMDFLRRSFNISDEEFEDQKRLGGIPSIKIGNLNVILVTSKETYQTWVDGVYEILREVAPVSRDKAVEVFQKHRRGKKYE